jgi:hypothetical protein
VENPATSAGFWRTLALVCSIQCLICAPILAQSPSAIEQALLLDIVNEHDSNRSGLDRHGSAAFRVRTGVLPEGTSRQTFDLDQIVWQPLLELTGRYRFDGSHAVYELGDSPAELARRNTPSTEPRVLSAVRLLTDGRTTLVDFPDRSSGTTPSAPRAHLESRADAFYSRLEFPMRLGAPAVISPDLDIRIIHRAATGQTDWPLKSIDPDARCFGTRVVKLAFESRIRECLEEIVWVDRSRGSIPIRTRMQTPDGALLSQTEYADLRYIPDRGWMPHRLCIYETSRGSALHPGDRILVREIQIMDANFAQPPDRSEFRLEFPEVVRLTNISHGGTFPEKKSWDLDAISREAEIQGAKVDEARARSIVFPPAAPRRADEDARLVWGGLFTLVLAAAAVSRFRRPPRDIDRERDP